MSRLDLIRPNQQQHTLRKFPQRSQSLRVKSNVVNRFGEPSLASSRSHLKLIITHKDLVVQDSLSQSLTSPFSKHDYSSRSGLVRNQSLQPLDSTLKRYQSLRRSSSQLNDNNSSKPATLVINCSFSPNLILSQQSQLQRNSFDNYDESLCYDYKKSAYDKDDFTLFEDTNGEDEGVITNEDNLEESEDDYEDFEEDSDDSYHTHTRLVYLVRHPQRGLGLSIAGGSDYSLPVIVVEIQPDSTADVSQNIYIGDQIISVNDVPINDTTSHHDALRLLSECGDQVCLNLRHYKASIGHRKRWKRNNFVGEVCNDSKHCSLATLKPPDYDKSDKKKAPPVSNNHGFNRSSSMNTLTQMQRIDLFMAGVSQYVSYSDKLRDSSLEVRSSDGNQIVIQCSKEEICLQWRNAIKSTIDNLTNKFMHNFNQHYPQRDHFFYMGWVSECLTIEPDCALVNSPLSKHSLGYRWLSRYLIVKGGNVYLFKSPPTLTLQNFMQKITNAFSRNRSGSSGSSLGSVGSSVSDGSNSSNSAHLASSSNLMTHSCDSNVISSKLRKAKPYQMVNLNKDLESELIAQSIVHFSCYKSQFRCLKSSELFDSKNHCFVIKKDPNNQKCYSTEDKEDLEIFQRVWNKAMYHSVIKLKNKTFTVVLEEQNIFGSFILDWRYGFSFYDPKCKHYLWSYKFHQLKHSSDDGKSRLFLSFGTEQNEIKHVLSSSCLQTLISCINAFLCAKVFSLSL